MQLADEERLSLLREDMIRHVVTFDEDPGHLPFAPMIGWRDEINVTFLYLAIRCVLQENKRLASNVNFASFKNILQNSGIILTFGFRAIPAVKFYR